VWGWIWITLCRENSQNKNNIKLNFCGLYMVFATLFLMKNTGNTEGRKTAILYFAAENTVDIFLPKANTFRFTVLASSGGILPLFPLNATLAGEKGDVFFWIRYILRIFLKKLLSALFCSGLD